MAGSLEELWISYNQIASLDGLSVCTNLTTLYISNNLIKSWNELDKLVSIFYSKSVFVITMLVTARLVYRISEMFSSLVTQFMMNVLPKILLGLKY